MEQLQEVKHSLSENWQHQREVSDLVVLLKEKVSQLETAKRVQQQFIAGIMTSFVLAVFYFGSQSAQVMNNSEELAAQDVRIRAIGPVINDVATDIEGQIVVLEERINDHHINHPVTDHKH